MKTTAELQHEEISLLARMNWQLDGSPLGHDLDYWLHAEKQLKATWELLARRYKESYLTGKMEVGGFLASGTLKTPSWPVLS